MLILGDQAGTGQLVQVFPVLERELAVFERRVADGQALPLATTVAQATDLVQRLLAAYVVDGGRKTVPATGTDLLAVFKVLVKGEPTWNAIRDNCRELVYYGNCINMGREDALPAAAEKMAVRTVRHIFLYVRTRCIREGRLSD